MTMPITTAAGTDARATCPRHNQFANASTGDAEEWRRSRISRNTDAAKFAGAAGIGRAASFLRFCSTSFAFISININDNCASFPYSFLFAQGM
jgi:hypothetical protein